MERLYFTINESTARIAKEINSFSEYNDGTATAEYKAVIDELYSLLEVIKQRFPRNAEKAEYMIERYAKKYADYLNDYYRNEASCPSVLICGAGNFPTGKKNKQNARRETLMNEYDRLEAYKRRIKELSRHDAPIKSGDADAIERLEDKLADLEAEQERMKAINAYYRKNKTCVGCELIDEETAKRVDAELSSDRCWYDVPFPSYKLTNNNATIRNTKARIENLKKAKEQGNVETETDLFKIVENTDIMRLQLIFDGKPDADTRTVLKNHGFRWSPNNSAWQRQLTTTSKIVLQQVIKELQ